MFSKILNHKITLIIAIVLFIGSLGSIAYVSLFPPQWHFTTATAVETSLQEKFTDQGVVESDNDVSLSFQNGGTVSAIDVGVGSHVSAGTVLASLNQSSLDAQLASAQADVNSAPAAISANGGTASLSGVSLTSTIQDAYLKSEDAILNKSDLLFTNPTSANPQITISIDSFQSQLDINNDRIAIGDRLASWKSDIAKMGSSTPSETIISESADNLSFIQQFLAVLSAKTNRLTVGNSGMTQTAIAADIADINAAQTEVNAALSEFNSAHTVFETANGGLAKALANVNLIQTEMANSEIIAPFDGIIGSIIPKIGEVVGAGTPAITLLSNGTYKIDVYVPENQVANIMVGDTATVTFDADKNLSATATVATIDLSPTTENSINAYKITLYFSAADQRIRSGMTANVTLNGKKALNVIAVPQSAIISNNGSYFVLAKNASDTFTEIPVETGITTDNFTEIRSGLDAGTIVAAFGTSH
ncbi:MAG: efflux RND transporter periplasmic adaptor subunit [Patescibacteria group bacterium]|nr:efflux RND transporter periplasmic adaptor subunit [Patescibacteria group bacterium]